MKGMLGSTLVLDAYRWGGDDGTFEEGFRRGGPDDAIDVASARRFIERDVDDNASNVHSP